MVLIALAGCDIGSTSNGASNNQGGGGPLVCLGDSLTAGYGAATPGREDKTKSYPAYLQNKVRIPVINAGVSADTTSQGLARVDIEVIPYDPQIVIILLGANDFGRGIPITAVRDNLQKIITKINNGKRMIYLAKFYTEEIAREMGNQYGLTDYIVQTVIINQLDSMYNTLASENNIILIEDIWHGVWGVHMSDAVHPNARGYEIMADNIINILLPYLQANNLLN